MTATSAPPRRRSAEPTLRPGAARWGGRFEHLVLAALAFVPQLLSQPGVVDSDTKSYLLLDPARFMAQSASMWNTGFSLGTVTHEQIGYLWPMGPFFLVAHVLGIPLWVTERLWVGGTLFAAGAGVLYLCRTLGLTGGLSGPGRLVGAVAYMLSPYFLQYVGRISVILLPWAGLPWMVGLVVRALRSRGGRGWRHPALLALLATTVGSTNASSLIYVGIAPALFLPYAVVVTRQHTWRQVWAVLWRVALLAGLVSAWWIVGLEVESAYGLNVLKYTETVPAVSASSLSSEVLRGLGYWYFYGSDRLGQWVDTSVQYTQELWLLGLSLAVPALAFAAAVLHRWTYRAYFVGLVVIGMVLAVGAHPFDSPSPVGALLKAFMSDTTSGLAMRSTDRASPLVLLGTAMLLGAGATAVARRVRKTGVLVALALVGLVCAADPPVFNGTTVADNFTQPQTPPSYVMQAAAWLDTEGGSGPNGGSEVLAIPGENFAAYRWGDTIDPVWPGVLTRPFVTREQQVYGSLATEDVLYALDDPIQEGSFVAQGIAPMAGLLGAGTVLVQSDLAYERYNQPLPAELWQQLTGSPTGLGPPVAFGAPGPNTTLIPMVSEATLAASPNLALPAPLEAMAVPDPRALVRAEDLAGAVVVDGDATGVAAAADVGLLDGNPLVLYASSFDRGVTAPRGWEAHTDLAAVTASSPVLVLTDTNRRQGFRWNNVRENAGYTETATEQPPVADPTDEPLDLFSGAPTDAETTTLLYGVRAVTASSYGNDVTYIPEDRPVLALDGDPDTAWQTGAFGFPTGQWWQVTLDRPVTTGSIGVVQPVTGDPDRWITRATLTFDGGHPVTVKLGAASRTTAGQTLRFPTRTFSKLRITIDATNRSQYATTGGLSAVGLAEVRLPGVAVREAVALPQDMLRTLGRASTADRLVVVLTRLRVAPYPPRSDPELAMDRVLWLPAARTFSVSGTARVSALVPDDTIDRMIGRPGAGVPGDPTALADPVGIVAYSNSRLPGALDDGAQAALDGNSATMWSPGFGVNHQRGDWIQVNLASPISVSHLDLQIVADGHHSVPTALELQAVAGPGQDSPALASVHVALPAIADGRRQGTTVSVPVSFPALRSRFFRLTITGARFEYSDNYFSKFPIALPLGIAELGIPGVRVPPPPRALPDRCRSDLLSIDGKPVWLRVVGTSASALAGDGEQVELCGPSAAGVTLGPGLHTVVAADGQATGWNLDQLVLDSAAGGGPGPTDPDAGGLLAPAAPAPATDPVVRVLSATGTALRVRVSGARRPFVLALGESQDSGWVASADGRPLGTSGLVDGFANGWLVDPGKLGTGSTMTVTLTWTPQQRVDLALAVSALAALACVVLALWPRRRRAASPGDTEDGPAHARRGHRPSPASFDRAGAPELASPLTWPPSRRRLLAAPVVAVGCGALAALVVAPWTAAVVAPVALVGMVVRRGRLLGALAPAGLVVATGVYMVVQQHALRVPAIGYWPDRFEEANLLVWLAVVLLGTDAVVESVRAGREGRAGARPDADGARHPPT